MFIIAFSQSFTNIERTLINMHELILGGVVFSIAFLFGIIFFIKFRKFHLTNGPQKKSFWNNKYIFDTIPSIYPTLGILCTAAGITLGIWNFNTLDIEASMPELLQGLKLAFFATMLGIIGLLIFQKVAAIILQEIDEHNAVTKEESNELSALNTIIKNNSSYNRQSLEATENIVKLLNEIKNQISQGNSDKDIKMEQISSELSHKLDDVVSNLSQSNINILKLENTVNTNGSKTNTVVENLNKDITYINTSLSKIHSSLSENNAEIVGKIEQFSEILAKNNTEALVEVMTNVTTTFNNQMNELIERLVKENFEELNNSVLQLNKWQHENIEHVTTLTKSYQTLTQNFSSNAATLDLVTNNVQQLVGDNSKLNEIIESLNKVLVDENNFNKLTKQLINSIELIETNTQAFSETTDKLNIWIRNEHNFKESTDILIIKLEEFKNFNSDVWIKYRKEMDAAVAIIENTSLTISKNLADIDEEFYERLSATLENLDMCIQRAITNYDN